MYGFPMTPRELHPDVERLLSALAVLAHQTRGELRQYGEREVYETLGMPYGTWRDRRKAGQILNPDMLIGVARAVEVNPVGLMVECGVLTHDEAIEYVDTRGDRPPTRATVTKEVTTPPKARRTPRLRDLQVKGDGSGLG